MGGEGWTFNAGTAFYCASVKVRSGMGDWTDSQGKQLLGLHHFKATSLECPFQKYLLLDKTINRVTFTFIWKNLHEKLT